MFLKNFEPSEKQWDTIYMIEEVLGVVFEGKSRKAANLFISTYLDECINKKEGLVNPDEYSG